MGTFFESGGETEVYLTRQEAWRHYISYISVVRVSGWTFIVHGVYTNPEVENHWLLWMYALALL